MFNFVYFLLLLLGSPYFLFCMLFKDKYRAGLAERFGKVAPRNSEKSCFWIHGVSVGEILAAKTLVKKIEQEFPDYEIVLSTTTKTGHEVARKNYPDKRVIYFPVDFSWTTSRFLKKINPRCIILMELEFWPNFLLSAGKRNIPVILVNGRISEKSRKFFKMFWGILRKPLSSLKLICMQNAEYAERMVDVGFDPQEVNITGNMKYDTVVTEIPEGAAGELKSELGFAPDALVIVGGSTHEPEEKYLLAIFSELKKRFVNLKLILVPRHPERFDAVEKAIQISGFPYARKTVLDAGEANVGSPVDVILIDKMGELSRMYWIADVVFVGGSLIPHGGQNMLESAALAKPTLFGPDTFNFAESVKLLLEGDGAREVADEKELQDVIEELLQNPDKRARLGTKGREIVKSQQGSTDRHVDLIKEYLLRT